ncbi:MAG TPA: hypothetical protein VMF91_17425 [Bryobacteraceae bacterium]|nr:hypothetical protein [Bryobacteraceae bacterium]
MRRCSCWFSLALAVLLLTHAVRADDTFTFTTEPSPGDVAGPAGTTIGWGYSITNNSSTDYLDLTGIDGSLLLATDGTPDASPFDFPILAPGQTVTEYYEDDPSGPGTSVGLFQFTWNSDVPVGTMETGYFELYGAFCDPTDPFCFYDGTPLSTSDAIADYTATVVPATGSAPTPEPCTALMMGLGMMALAILRWRTKQAV